MKQRKIFLGIALPSDAAKRLASRTTPYKTLPIRLTKQANFHVTVLFLGHVLDESVAEICERVGETCSEIPAFDIDLETISLVPERGKEAKQLWYHGTPNDDLKHLREALEKALDMFITEKKQFRPHVTLGRIRKQLWQVLDTPPAIEETLKLHLPVDSVIVYESVFKKGEGLVYESLAECPLLY